MHTATFAFLAALLVALLLTPLARRLAFRVGAVDQVGNARKIHRRPVARLGGVAIVGAFYSALAALALCDGDAASLLRGGAARLAALLAGGLAVAGIGLLDDLRGAPARLKLAVELSVAAMLWLAGYRIDAVALPLLGEVALGWAAFPVTVLWIAGVVNAVNLIDGLDGLAAGVSTVAAAAIALLAAVGGSPLVVILAAALGGAALGFLRYNFNPASIFMGDTGSLFLGFVLAVASLETHHESSTAVGLLVSALVLGLPIADTALAIGRRALRGAPIFRADREHIHHRLLDSGLGHRGAVLVLWAASLCLAAAALLLAIGGETVDRLVVAALLVACPAALWRLGMLGRPRLARARPVGAPVVGEAAEIGRLA